MKWIFACVLAACVDSSDPGGPWVDASAITGTFATESGPSPLPREAPACTLRIATWNLHTAPDPADLARQIAASREISRADVILTQEVEAHPNESGSRPAQLATALGMTWIYAPSRTEGNGTHGIAILSRYPLAHASVRQLPFVDRPFSLVHRIALSAEVDVGGEPLRVVDLHLDTRLSASDRVRQMNAGVTDLGEELVAGGDLNSQPWVWIDGTVPLTGTEAIVGQDHAQILDDFMRQNRYAGAVGPETDTMNVPVISMRLDQLYARRFTITGSGVEHVKGSDHWPVWFDLAWTGCR